MKRSAILILLFIYSCSASKPILNDPDVGRNHPKPVRIFSVGYWNKDYMILTLTDAKNGYFVIKTQRNDSLKVGKIYLQ